ncbi:hypothetical protein [Candidatus Avelusimicrobium fimicolum]|uniref:hypothetical protein n=1 Tax=Candidatus Avelusimicrobium fimicolum TaxID=3416216 RepID=UPI003D102257
MKKLINILLAATLGALLLGNCQKAHKIDRLTETSATLPAGQQATVKVADNKVITTVRRQDGTVDARVQYAPPEGSVSVVQPASGPATVRVKRAGFTFRPAAQGLAGKDLKIGLGARLLYFDRYGAGVGVSHDLEPYLFADRRVDDLVGIFKNTTVGVFGGPRSAGIMLGVYF